MIRLLDQVSTLEAIPDALGGGGALAAGSRGTVVVVHAGTPPAYEVEFADEDGRTIALLVLVDEQLLPVAAP